MRRLERKVFKEAAKKKLVRPFSSESEEGGNNLSLVPLRKIFPEDTTKKSTLESG